MTKKGISPLIATVLLVAFVIVIFLFVSNWIRVGVVDEATQGTQERLTSNVGCMGTILDVRDVQYRADGGAVIMNVDNVGDTTLSGIKVRVMNAAGAVGSADYSTGAPYAPLERVVSVSTELDLSSDVTTPNSVEVYPEVSGGLCKDQVKSVGELLINSY